ncbi:dienelactone hydrolase family protein [Sphingomonas sp. GCM10030256]|uniref:dienelactone hydrolase family protein n=1 Tax=Sphingomonas sp. GCM10030256 TaxID=3273427 RepID=UPI003623ADCE
MDNAASRSVTVHRGRLSLPALLRLPERARGLVIFAHGSGSGRLSPRNNHVADALAQAGFASLLLDLLTPSEEADRRNVFDIELLASRLLAAIEWAREQSRLQQLPIGLFGASTGAGAALVAAAAARHVIWAVVSRGGRPDLAGTRLHEVKAPTLLIVGGNDGPVIDLNEAALTELHCPKSLLIVPGAGHLFEEPGTLDQVIAEAIRWYGSAFPQAEGDVA